MSNKHTGRLPAWLRALLPGQLSVTLFVWLIGSILLAEAVWLFPSYLDRSRELWRDAEVETRRLVKVAVDPLAPNTLLSEMAIFRRLKATSAVVGMRIENKAGETISLLGDAPALTGIDARTLSVSSRPGKDLRFLDIYLPDSETLLNHVLVLRIDMSRYFAKFNAWLGDELKAIAAVTLLLGSIGYYTLYFVLIWPVMKVHRAISGALEAVHNGRIEEIEVSRTDEIGGIAMHTNQILYELARSSSTTTAIATRAIDDSRIAAVVYDAEGKPIYANRGGYQLFSAKELAGISDGKTRFLTVNRGGTTREHSVEELVDRSTAVFEATMATAGGVRKFLCAGHVDIIDGKTVRQRTVQFVEIDALLARIDKAYNDRDQETARRKEADRQAVTAKLTLESCMLLMGTGDNIKPQSGGLVDLAEIITGWARTRGTAGMGRPIRYSELPRIAGNKDQLTTVFNQALSFIDYRSIFDGSEVRVLATVRDGIVFFELSEKAGEDRTLNKRAASGGSEEWTLCFAALSRLIGALGGYVDTNPQRPGPAQLSFTLPKIIGRRPAKEGAEDADEDLDAA